MWLLLPLLLLDLPRVSLHVRPQAMHIDTTLWLECRVARHADNLGLEFGLVDRSSSWRELDGANAPVIHSQYVRAQCPAPVVAFCRLVSRDRDRLVQQEVLTACDP